MAVMLPAAMVVTDDVTAIADRPYRTPGDVARGGLPGFLDRVAARLGAAGGGTVLVNAAVAGKLGLPDGGPLATGDDAKNHPAAVAARKAGWSVRDVHRWSAFTRGGVTVHIGLCDYIDPGYVPAVDIARKAGHVARAAAGLSEWHRSVGVPWVGDAGDAVNALIMDTARCYRPGTKSRFTPIWRPQHNPPPGYLVDGKFREAIEHPYYRSSWERAGHEREGRYLHGFDAVRSYLAAMASVEVAAVALAHTGRRPFDPKLSGWWLVDLDPWTETDLPDPAGYDPGRPVTDGSPLPRWLSTPRVHLLDQLRDDGRYGGFTVLDSWTGHGTRGVLRPAAGKLDAAYRDGSPVLRACVQAGYHAVHGHWRNRASDIRRHDWAGAVVGAAGANLWRKVDRSAVAHPGGVYLPAFLDGIDTAYYPSEHADPDRACPPGFTLVDDDDPKTDVLGRYRAKYLHDRARRRRPAAQAA